ncbi:MAG TPA: rhomboid family protein [Verrucomicrobiae bacterium]|nr:rhomboid family protein [Verrucomicrobiae bacterium]
MPSLAHQRCSNHAAREAVARCPECQGFFCRECITEHDDRVLCAACLAKLTRRPLAQRFALVQLLRLVQCGIGFLFVWYFFFLVGEELLKLPDSFHQATLWHAHWPGDE